MNIERRRKLAVAEVLVSKKEQFGLSRGQRSKNATHALLLLGSSVKLFRRRDAANNCQQAFVSLAADLSAKLVQSEPNRGAIKPGLGLRCVGPRSVPKSNKCLDREFLSPSGIANDARNHPRNPIEPAAEQRLDVESRLRRGCRFEDNVARCVHIHITTQSRDL